MLKPSITIPVINRSAFPLPAYATIGSSGLDVRANIENPITLQSLERTLVPTGLFVEIPLGFEIQVRPRSGLAVKQGLTCLNTPGTIDADYRGEIKVILINLSQEPQIIQPGDRIAQLVLQSIELIEWKSVDQLNETDRGSGGFGHTGKQ
jgi:dUTP pyrophosphatase